MGYGATLQEVLLGMAKPESRNSGIPFQQGMTYVPCLQTKSLASRASIASLRRTCVLVHGQVQVPRS